MIKSRQVTKKKTASAQIHSKFIKNYVYAFVLKKKKKHQTLNQQGAPDGFFVTKHNLNC